MRKVTLRNVHPPIDDPDASTEHIRPSLAAPEVVANFKSRMAPRLPKPRKNKPEIPQIQPQCSALDGREPGFSTPGSFTTLSHRGAAG